MDAGGSRTQRHEIDGLDDLLSDDDQAMFDLALNRERRRERQGFATAAEARAFLQMSRQLRLGYDSVAPPANPLARAYFQAIDWTAAPGGDTECAGSPAASGGLSTPGDRRCADRHHRRAHRRRRPRAAASRSARGRARGVTHRVSRGSIEAQMQAARDAGDHLAYSMRTEELASLGEHSGNWLLHPGTAVYPAGGVRCGRRGLQPRPRDLACSMARGAQAGMPEDFLVHHDLISVFQVGWTVLHADVGMYAGTATDPRTDRFTNNYQDRETQAGLNALRIELKRGSAATARRGAPAARWT